MNSDPNAPRAAVIGTGRCGTGYMRRLLEAHDVKAGHEWWWRGDLPDPRPGLDVDCSWLALPQLEAAEWTGPTVHITRHPVQVVRSLVGIRFFAPSQLGSPFQRFALRHCPAVAGLPPVAAAVEWWCQWNARCAAVADLTVPIEGVASWKDALGAVAEALDVDLRPAIARGIPTDVNHRRRAEHVGADLVWSLVGGRAKAYGYTWGSEAHQ